MGRNCAALRTGLLLFLLFAFVSRLGADEGQRSPAPPDSPLARADRLYHGGQFEEAAQAYQEALRADAANLDAHRGYQNSLRKLRRTDRLLAEYKARVEREPVSPAAHYLYGRLLDGEAFEKEMQAAVHIDPEFYHARLALGQFYLKANRLQEAGAELKAAVAARSDSSEAHQLYAFVCAKIDAVELAEQHYRRALELRPDFPEARLGLALVLKSTGQYPEAAELLLAIVRKAPDAAAPYAPLIQCLNASGRYEEARTWRTALAALYASGRDPRLKETPEVDIDLIDMGDLFLRVSERFDRQGDTFPLFRFRVYRKTDRPDRPPLGCLTLQFTRFNPPERAYELIEEKPAAAGVGAPTRVVYQSFGQPQEYLDLLPRVKEIARSIQDR